MGFIGNLSNAAPNSQQDTSWREQRLRVWPQPLSSVENRFAERLGTTPSRIGAVWQNQPSLRPQAEPFASNRVLGNGPALRAFIGGAVGTLTDQIVSPDSAGRVGNQVTPVITQQAMPYLDLSDAAYKDSGAPEGWDRLHDDNIGGVALHDSRTGFDAEIFRNEQTNETVVAFRGSEKPLGNMNDWVENGKQVSGQHSPQYQQAMQLADAAKTEFSEVTFTGHSLGGGLAQTAAIHTDSTAWTFASTGIGEGTLGALGADSVMSSEDNITNLALKGDFVTDGDNHQDSDAGHTGRLLGTTYYAGDSGFDASSRVSVSDNRVTRHALSSLEAALAAVTS